MSLLFETKRYEASDSLRGGAVGATCLSKKQKGRSLQVCNVSDLTASNGGILPHFWGLPNWSINSYSTRIYRKGVEDQRKSK